MRKVLSLFLSCLFIVLCGCANPIKSIELGMNPLGGFDVTVLFTDGATITIPNVSPGQLVQLQKKYNIRSSQIVTRGATVQSACEVVNLAPTASTGYVIQTRPDSMAKRFGRSLGIGSCSCADGPVPPTPAPGPDLVWPHYDIPSPQSPNVTVRPATPSNLASRMSALESKMDKILALVEQIKK